MREILRDKSRDNLTARPQRIGSRRRDGRERAGRRGYPEAVGQTFLGDHRHTGGARPMDKRRQAGRVPVFASQVVDRSWHTGRKTGLDQLGSQGQNGEKKVVPAAGKGDERGMEGRNARRRSDRDPLHRSGGDGVRHEDGRLGNTPVHRRVPRMDAASRQGIKTNAPRLGGY